MDDRSIHVTGDLNIDNSGTMSLGGDVSGLMQSLGASGDENLRQLSLLLDDLHKQLMIAPALSQEDRALAVEKVAELAKAAASTKEGVLRKSGELALLALKGLATGIPEIVKIVDSIGKVVDAVGRM